jgi:hypothetical protein
VTAGKNHLNEITPLLPTGRGERYSQTISNLGHAALWGRVGKNPGFLKKTIPVGFFFFFVFWDFLGFFGFSGFYLGFLPRREGFILIECIPYYFFVNK